MVITKNMVVLLAMSSAFEGFDPYISYSSETWDAKPLCFKNFVMKQVFCKTL
ncbi:hypothetical protein HanHA300_Chr13g0488001 [Helianthus annuus]|nr:hypothetical protein HanHA300_Chr13g0488001 [Helianthus annuus]KAJ0498228.1 hypothetical protein HanHA89_Chr13g0520191 [Helianthus annuus]KAJ0664231.1 hypothetical protein HanLR1_Chr13g0490051 [Helianthus annuus]